MEPWTFEPKYGECPSCGLGGTVDNHCEDCGDIVIDPSTRPAPEIRLVDIFNPRPRPARVSWL